MKKNDKKYKFMIDKIHIFYVSTLNYKISYIDDDKKIS